MKQKGLAPIIIVVLIALGIGGYLIYQNQGKITSQSVVQPSPTSQETTTSNDIQSSPSPTSAPKPIIKIGWKNNQ